MGNNPTSLEKIVLSSYIASSVGYEPSEVSDVTASKADRYRAIGLTFAPSDRENN